MSEIAETITSSGAIWLFGIAAVLSAVAKIMRAKAEISRSAPNVAKTRHASISRLEPAPAASPATISRGAAILKMGAAVVDLSVMAGTFVILVFGVRSKAPLTEGSLAAYLLVVALLLASVIRSN